ncbi:MAG: putative DNA-binding domain-containing protein [Rhodobacteraceae bacterium]|nr:putative DNA-binding domain-containing protein [Paracoccaceae bacterium]
MTRSLRDFTPSPDPVSPQLAAGSSREARPGLDHRTWQQARRDLRLLNSLHGRFPAVVRHIDGDLFAGLARAFANAYPPRSPVLIDWGADMPAFLAEFGPTRDVAFLPDLARLEWLRWRALHAADARAMPAHELAGCATIHPEVLFLRLHPSVSSLRSACPVISIRERSFAPQSVAIGTWTSQSALVARVGDEVATFEIGAGAAAFVAALSEGATLAAARRCGGRAEPGFDSAPILDRLVCLGLVTGAC